MQADDHSEDTRIVAELLENFLAKVEAGESVDIDVYLEPHQQVAQRVKDCLESLKLVGNASTDLGFSPLSEFGSENEYQRIGGFRLICEIGRGGMGVVYEAEEEALGRHVALKILPYAALLNESRLARFQNEARAAAVLRHPNIVEVFSVGNDRGTHFYAMELIDGYSLAEDVSIEEAQKQSGSVEGRDAPEPLSPDSSNAHSNPLHRLANSRTRQQTIIKLGIQAADALDYAHERRVIHRDIKPSNLLVDRYGNLRIADFGLARFLDSEEELTISGDVVGTIRYMSPEQATTGIVDHRTDIYSLGVTLCELLTREPVIKGNTRGDALEQLIAGVTARQLPELKCLPRDLQTILLRSMATCPQDRYSTAKEMSEDLQRYLSHRPILARRTSCVRQLIGWAKRNPQLAIVSSSLVALLALAAISSSVIAWRASIEATRQRQTAYARDMLFALNAAENGMASEAREVLARWDSISGNKRDLRGWEWYWISKQAAKLAPECTIQPGPAGADCIRFSADGREIYAGHFGNRFSFFDATSGERTWVTRMSKSSIDELRLSHGGKQIAAFENDGSISFWDPDKKRESSSWKIPGSFAGSFAVSQDSQYVVVTTDQGEQTDAYVLKSGTGRVVRSFAFDGNVVGAFTANMLVLASRMCVQGYDLRSWDKVMDRTMPGLEPRCIATRGKHFAIAFSDDVSRESLIEMSADDSVEHISSIGVQADIRVLAFSPADNLVGAGDASGTLHLWKSNETLAEARRRVTSAAIIDMDFSPSGQQLVVTSEDTKIRTFKVADILAGERLSTIEMPTKAAIYGVGFCDRGRKVCAVGADGAFHVVDRDGAGGTTELKSSQSDCDKARLFTSPSGKWIAIVRFCFPSGHGQSAYLSVFDAETSRIAWEFTLPEGTYRPSLAYSRDESTMAVGSWDEVIILSAHEGQEVDRVKLRIEDRPTTVKALAFSVDGKRIYCGTNSGLTATVAKVGPQEWKANGDGIRMLSGEIMSFCISPDGKKLAVVGFDKRLTLWQLPSMRPSPTKFEVSESPLLHADFSPDGRRILTTSRSGFAEVWSAPSGHRLLSIRASDGWLDAGCFSPDGQSILLGGGTEVKLLSVLDETQ